MAKKKKVTKKEVENVIEEPVNVEETTKVDVPKVDLSKFKSKEDETITKVDLSSPTQEQKEETNNAVQESKTAEPMLQDATESIEKGEDTEVELQSVGSGDKEEEINVIQEITNEEPVIEEKVEEVVQPSASINLPENVEKLVSFMEETGGSVEDYVRLNADYTDVDGITLLTEYYKQTKPHLELDEIEFLMEDRFSFDEEYDEERAIRKKKLAMKEEIAKARGFLDGLKSKYYDEIKLRPGVTQEQQKATSFFDRYNKEQEIVKQHHEKFKNVTKNYFTQDFKGFDFNVGEKKFRYGVNNPSELIDKQSDIANFVRKFLNKDGSISDHKGYHKAIYAAQNADTIAKHFYEQGKSDAIKDVAAKSKNISGKPRSTPSTDIFLNGLRVKAITGVDSSRLKVQQRKK